MYYLQQHFYLIYKPFNHQKLCRLLNQPPTFWQHITRLHGATYCYVIDVRDVINAWRNNIPGYFYATASDVYKLMKEAM